MRVVKTYKVNKFDSVNVYGAFIGQRDTKYVLAGMNQENPKKYKVYDEGFGYRYFNFRGMRIELAGSN